MNQIEIMSLNNKDLLKAMTDYTIRIKLRLRESEAIQDQINMLIEEQNKLIKEYQARLNK